MLRVTDLRCEHDHEPIAVATPKPRFSWKLDGDGRNLLQADYRLQLSLDPAFASLHWDSGLVASGESHLVGYEGPPLVDATRYFFRVRASDNRDEHSDWSEVAWFETALPTTAWRASFIGLDEADEATSSRPIYLRREFSLSGRVQRGRIYATALGLYELWINGSRVGDARFAPGWTDYRKRLAFQAYDVTDLLRTGPNAIGAVLAAGWYSGELTWRGMRNLYGEHAALSLQLAVEVEGAETLELLTDSSWRTGPGPIAYSEIYHGERYDGRLEAAGWSFPGFDDAGWSPAVCHDFDAGRLVAQEGPPVKEQERLPALRLFETPRGERVLDFGQNLTGWVEFSVQGKAGDRVVLRHAEVLDAEGNFYTANLRSAKAQDEYILRGGGEERYAPHFTFHGFRYVELKEYPGKADPSAFTAVVLHSAMEPSLSFSCSNPLLERLHHNILWGWKGNALDVPTDCPQRDERLGWTGDAEVFIGTATFLTNAVSFFRKWLRDLASGQRPDGGVPHVVPDVLADLLANDAMIHGTHSSTGWGDAAVICPWTLFLHYGDLVLLREHYPSMKAWVEFIRSHAERGLLWKSGFHFGDWVALDAKEGSYFGATPNDLTATAFYAYSTDLLARAAEALGEAHEASEYRVLHRSIVGAFQEEFITPAGRIAARTQTAHILALVFGLVPEHHRRRVAGDLVALIEENEGHLTTGFLGTPFICRALAENGYTDEAYALLLREDYPSWLYQVTKGATTVWEHWDGIKPDGTMWSANMNSFNHYAYGAIGQWIYATVGGVAPNPEKPGFRSFLLAPQPGGGIESAKISYESPYGTIALEWRLEGDRLRMEAQVPPNSSARIVLAQTTPDGVEEPDGLEFREEQGCTVAEAGSGRYRLVCRWR